MADPVATDVVQHDRLLGWTRRARSRAAGQPMTPNLTCRIGYSITSSAQQNRLRHGYSGLA